MLNFKQKKVYYLLIIIIVLTLLFFNYSYNNYKEENKNKIESYIRTYERCIDSENHQFILEQQKNSITRYEALISNAKENFEGKELEERLDGIYNQFYTLKGDCLNKCAGCGDYNLYNSYFHYLSSITKRNECLTVCRPRIYEHPKVFYGKEVLDKYGFVYNLE